MRCYFRLGGQLEFDAVGGRTRRVGTVLFRMRCYFRLGGQLEFDAVGGRTRGLGLSYFGCGVTSDWVASWSLTRWEDGHGGLGLFSFRMR